MAGNSFSSNLELRTSLGYDFVSQEYFLDSATTDSTLSVWLLKNNYLDDFKGRISLLYHPFNDRRLELQPSFEQSSELYRLRFNSNWRPKIGKSRLDISSEMERRGRHRGTSEFGDSYLLGYSRASLTVPVSERVSTKFQLMADMVSFDSAAAYNYTYYRIGPKIGIVSSFEGFSFLDANLFFITRQVPDSAELDYLNFGIDGSFLGLMDGGDLDLYARLERKDYNRPDARDDHFRFNFDGRGKIKMGESHFTRIELQTEIVHYSPENIVNFDHGRTGWAVLVGLEKDGWSAGVGPAFELMMEQEGSFKAAEDYFEIGGKVDLEVLKGGRFFGSIESTLGYRNLSVEEQYYTNFMFERLNTIGNFTVFGALNWSWLFSAEWEWHSVREENFQIFLLSTSLTYSI